MAAASATALTPAIITASASILVAAAVFVGNVVVGVRNERRQAALDRVNAQIRDLYGPLMALVAVNENLWGTLRRARLPGRAERRSGTPTEAQAEEWKGWLREALMPVNRQMRDLIMRHADLIIEDEIPPPLVDFCTHVASYEVLLAAEKVDRPLVPHPGEPFPEHVRNSFDTLKGRQTALLRKNAFSR